MQYCLQMYGRKATLRFINWIDGQSASTGDISFTALNQAMGTKDGENLRRALEEVALSPDILWRTIQLRS